VPDWTACIIQLSSPFNGIIHTLVVVSYICVEVCTRIMQFWRPKQMGKGGGRQMWVVGRMFSRIHRKFLCYIFRLPSWLHGRWQLSGWSEILCYGLNVQCCPFNTARALLNWLIVHCFWYLCVSLMTGCCMMNWKGFGRKLSLHNHGTHLSFIWKC